MTGYYSEWKMQSLLNQPVGASSHVSVSATGQTDCSWSLPTLVDDV